MEMKQEHKPCEGKTSGTLYKIGMFAAMNHVTVKTLRFYEEQGLLMPALIHPETGYRYYTLSQMAVLHQITALKLAGFTLEEIVRIHSQSDYYVYMLGFAPGHPYGARMENPFSFKRRPTPRVKIPAGSIVVQLGLSDIIPFDQPCGWNIIGTTPVPAYDPRKENPFLLQAGQWMRHVPISREEFAAIRRQVEAGTYVPKTCRKEKTP